MDDLGHGRVRALGRNGEAGERGFGSVDERGIDRHGHVVELRIHSSISFRFWFDSGDFSPGVSTNASIIPSSAPSSVSDLVGPVMLFVVSSRWTSRLGFR